MSSCIVRSSFASLLVLAGLSPLVAEAQLVTPRTVPVFQDEQFQIYPTSRPGLGGLSIAIDDTLADPFSNPARASRLRGMSITTAPYSHGISGSRGGGRTLPIAFMAGGEQWSGTFLGAFQQIDRAGPVWNRPTSEQVATNQYVSASVARKFADGLSVGISGSHADLAAVDGVDLLYAGSDRIDQSGSLLDLRLGATKEFGPGHSLDLVAVHNRTRMQHDVHFSTWTWDPLGRMSVVSQRSETNLDQTNIWGLHSKYVRPVGVEGWRVGGVLTANHLSHPKIPNYVIQNLPRDPGSTNAFNVGVGAARDAGPFTFGVDVIIEPMFSDTWADAATSTQRADGSIIPAGQKTVENHFQFHNSKAALGVGRKWVTDSAKGTSLTLDFGLSMYSIVYDLKQTNNITRTTRTQRENWVESGPSFGLRYRSHDIEMSYAFRASCGNGGCDLSPFQGGGDTLVAAPSTGGIIAAPASPLFIQSGSETSHHFTITVPIR